MSTEKQETYPVPYGGHEWPETLYPELMDMGILAELVYSFGYLVDAARKSEGKFAGIDLDDDNRQISKSSVTDSHLKRSFSAAEMKKVIQDNIKILEDYGVSSDFRGEKLDRLYGDLDMLIAKCKESGDDRAIVLEEYDDKFQTMEPVYGVFKDSIDKRIILAFRGSDELGFTSNWITNIRIPKTDAVVPDAIKEEVDGKKLKFHSGFYDYLFKKTVEEEDAADTVKFDQILSDVKALMGQNPGYKLYVTGHSLGAALSTLSAFYLSCDPDIPKPVSNINFASPRLGNETVLEAANFLEKTGQLRIMRAMNDNDSVTAVPSVGYHHVGFQVIMDAANIFGYSRDPVIHYPNLKGSRLGRTWKNGFLASINLGYDHGMTTYLERIEEGKDVLETQSLNSLYLDEKLTGYKVQG